MENLNHRLEIRPKKFVLTKHLIEESLPKKINWFKEMSQEKRISFVQSSFSKTRLYEFSSLPSIIKNKWVLTNHHKRYFRLDPEANILYVCSKMNNGKEIVISGYDFRCRENFGIKELI